MPSHFSRFSRFSSPSGNPEYVNFENLVRCTKQILPFLSGIYLQNVSTSKSGKNPGSILSNYDPVGIL